MKLQIFNPRETAQDVGEMEFKALCDFNEGGGGVFWSSAGGRSPWEMHPDCDELLHVVEGEIEVEVLPQDGSEGFRATVQAGSYLVVPRGCWHRQQLKQTSTEFYLTPGRTLHSHSEDPRTDV